MKVVDFKTREPAGRGSFAGMWLVVLVGLGGLAAYSAAYTLHETEQAVVVQMGDPVRVVTEAGLHFKIPFVQEVRRFDKRIEAWDGEPNEIPTLGGEFIWVDTTARWRIVEPQKFMESVRDVASARTRLSDVIDSVLRDQIAGSELVEIVRSKDWGLTPDQRLQARLLEEAKLAEAGAVAEAEAEATGAEATGAEATGAEAAPELPADAAVLADLESEEMAALTERVEKGRQAITRTVLEKSREVVSDYGIELVDVQIKRINYVASVQEQVFRRMISDQERRAEKFRSEGQGESARILGEARRELATIRSEAELQAQIIRGEADAEATRIYSEAYTPYADFYAFLRTLESYQETIGASSTLLLGTDSEYFRYMRTTEP